MKLAAPRAGERGLPGRAVRQGCPPEEGTNHLRVWVRSEPARQSAGGEERPDFRGRPGSWKEPGFTVSRPGFKSQLRRLRAVHLHTSSCTLHFGLLTCNGAVKTRSAESYWEQQIDHTCRAPVPRKYSVSVTALCPLFQRNLISELKTPDALPPKQVTVLEELGVWGLGMLNLSDSLFEISAIEVVMRD